jgi:phosphoglycerol transferase
VGGIPDVVDRPRFGELVPPKDLDALVGALDRVSAATHDAEAIARESGLRDWITRHDAGVAFFSPIMHGLLLGKYDVPVSFPEGDFRSNVEGFGDVAVIERMKRARREVEARWPSHPQPVLHALVGALLSDAPAGCVLLGLNYIYFAFFGAFVIAVGTAVGALRARSWSLVAVGGLCVAAVGLAIALNLVPNAIAWEAYGEPLGVRHVPAEAEYYGLKIRHLIGPAPEHWFPPLRAWAEAERAAEFPYETENIRATLGIVATTGFVWLLVTLVLSPNGESGERRRLVRAAAVVVIAIVLLATVGGFGSLFSLLVTPDIRAYNRISPFIAFLALVVVAFWIDRAWARKPKIQVGVAIAVVAIGLADQLPALSPRRADHAAIAQVFGRTQAFVALLEARLPRDAMVYQLPVRPYPRDPGLETLGVYDQFRPYLSSRQLRWSYPSLTVKQINRERAISAVEESDLPRYLARQGFSAILISRAGYRDRGRQLEDALRQPRAGTTLLASSDDYVALDLRPLSPRTVTR